MHAVNEKPRRVAVVDGKARCLATIECRLPDAFRVDVSFRKPIFLPGHIEFTCDTEDEGIAFAVRDAKRENPHLDGLAGPIESKPRSERKHAK